MSSSVCSSASHACASARLTRCRNTPNLLRHRFRQFQQARIGRFGPVTKYTSWPEPLDCGIEFAVCRGSLDRERLVAADA